MSEKIYRVQMNSKGMPNFSTAVEIADRPSGEWIDDIEAESNGYYWANCSQCGLQIDVHENRGYYNYCPNCGARMKGADDEVR